MSRLLILLIATLLPPVLSSAALAAPITFSYTGTVSGGGEANGQTLSVTFRTPMVSRCRRDGLCIRTR